MTERTRPGTPEPGADEAPAVDSAALSRLFDGRADPAIAAADDPAITPSARAPRPERRISRTKENPS